MNLRTRRIFMQRKVANQQTIDGQASATDALVHRMQHLKFPANCRQVDEHIRRNDEVFDNTAANFLQVLDGWQLLGVQPGDHPAQSQGSTVNESSKSFVKKQVI